MKVRKIGDWKEEGPYGNFDHGFYLEAVDIPRAAPRYTQVSYSFIDDADIRRLARGETVDLDLTQDDLQARIS